MLSWRTLRRRFAPPLPKPLPPFPHPDIFLRNWKNNRVFRDLRFEIGIGFDFDAKVVVSTVKCSKEVATAIHGAIILAKLSVIPVRRGYWGNKIGKPHIVPCKVTGKCGSITVRMVPAPRGNGLIFCSYFLGLWFLNFNFLFLDLGLCSYCSYSRHT